ncbi:unnamed protein product [Cuscuta epithymum]|uniref:Uncharacterized protein n=1 Tax=Cuscuta epithymum TaxID=186058 RepID=A0AAV0DGZ9_9ASTE|nr:unnamed protein product [Cuscuta epithymum]
MHYVVRMFDWPAGELLAAVRPKQLKERTTEVERHDFAGGPDEPSANENRRQWGGNVGTAHGGSEADLNVLAVAVVGVEVVEVRLNSELVEEDVNGVGKATFGVAKDHHAVFCRQPLHLLHPAYNFTHR